ncbi:rod shape-determining protein MreD [Ligilactobacillus ceti]|uniref:Rod shape-determining protein mred n=1 Tax=Ligilactobacillus ceti DSM 22408 TaxID=1122146 RepID=A0A0R2KPY8_9LACO|nr:rod shape-determining protein MreD [Ligilactobacillus ceti]KRN88972.1 rod shape-determining protein mred [Ligilactobacillus ceti DSM 22408]
MKFIKMKYLFPIGLFLALFLDGSLTLAFDQYFFTPFIAIESRLVLLWLIMAVCYSEVEHILLWSGFVGAIFDIYYLGVMGIFILIFPLIVYLTREIMQFLNRSFIVVLLVYLIDITVVTILFYWVNSLIGFTSVSVTEFISRTLGPTLVYNLLWFVLLYYPLERLFEDVQ